MRLFIAIDFSQENKDILDQITKDLAASITHGRPMSKDNHHLTLAFIGESDQVKKLSDCIDRAMDRPFSLIVSKLACFGRSNGDILYLGIKDQPQLKELQQRLNGELKRAGFILENRPFKPHLTLMRDAVYDEDFDFRRFSVAMPKVTEEISSVGLYKSERINGKLIYTKIYEGKMADQN